MGAGPRYRLHRCTGIPRANTILWFVVRTAPALWCITWIFRARLHYRKAVPHFLGPDDHNPNNTIALPPLSHIDIRTCSNRIQMACIYINIHGRKRKHAGPIGTAHIHYQLPPGQAPPRHPPRQLSEWDRTHSFMAGDDVSRKRLKPRRRVRASEERGF